MGRTLLVERAKSCKENQLVNQNKIIRNIYIVLSFEEPKIVWIASAKSRSVRGASHQPVFMGSCLTIGHMC